VAEREELAGKAIMETVMLGLRLGEGVRWQNLPAPESELAAWQRAAQRLAGEGCLVADADGVRVATQWRRLTDSLTLRLWEEAERESGRGSLR
jgi:coproporphyrinogen III oxidase-like Fe-S oxidoreductase